MGTRGLTPRAIAGLARAPWRGPGDRFFNGAANLSGDLLSSNDLQTPALKPVKHSTCRRGVVGHPHDVGLPG